MGSGGNVSTICNQYADDEEVQRLDYLGRYKQAMAGIRHHVVITSEGDIETLDKNNAPHDLHDCVGQRLPEELNMYLSRGMIRPRVLNWLASGTILILAPYDGGDSKVYQNLVRQQLEPLRRQTLSLLADSLNRYYQRKEITTKYWFDSNTLSSVNIKDLLPSPKDSINSWNVKEDAMLDRQQTLGVRTPANIREHEGLTKTLRNNRKIFPLAAYRSLSEVYRMQIMRQRPSHLRQKAKRSVGP